MDSLAQIDGGSSKRNQIIPFNIVSDRQKMCSKPQNLHRSTPRQNFAIIPNSFDIKNHAQPHGTLRISPKPQNQFEKLQKIFNIWQIWSPPRETREPLRETRKPGETAADRHRETGTQSTIPSKATPLQKP